MLRGCLLGSKDDDTDRTIAKLPEGARPSSSERFQCMTVTSKDGKPAAAKCHTSTIIISPDGTISVQSVHEGELWLSNIVFTIA